MNDLLKLKIITPDKVEFDDYIAWVSFNSINGITVLQKNYAPTIGSIYIGKITIHTQTETISKIIGKGAYSICDNYLEIITNFFLNDTNENIDFIEQRKINAEKQLTEHATNLINFEHNLNITKIIQQLRGK